MPVVKDRRSSLRVEIEGRVRVHTNRDEFEGRCVDLGLDGIALRSTRAARPGEPVTLDALVDGQRLRIEAKLVRRQRARGEYLLGFAFVELDLDTQRRVEHLLFERLTTSPQADFMRAFVAHADRVPPPAARERTVVVGALQVPVISGHTQVVEVSSLSMVDRTVIAPPPPRGDTVLAESLPAHVPSPVQGSGAPDEAWLDDEMDTAQFRLLEAAQAREAAEREAEEASEVDDEELELALLEPDEPVSEHTVVVGGFATQPREHTLVTTETPERPLVERTAPLLSGGLLEPARAAGVPEPAVHGSTLLVPLDAEPLRDVPAERTLPFLRDLLPDSARLGPPMPQLHVPERTAVVASRPAADAVLRPTVRALLDATAMLRRPDPSARGRRGPRVIVAVPHRTHRRKPSTPWNQQ